MASTQIVNRQIADGAIDNSKVAAGAAIASTKLADGANFTKKDGSVAFTGDQSMGGNKLTSVGTPSSSNDAATKSYVDTAVANLNSVFKYRNVRAATTANITLSNPGTGTFDGVALSQGDRLLVRAQTSQAENGIYIFDTSSTALVRASDADAWTEFPGSLVSVNEGTLYGDARFFCPVNDGGTLNTTAITYTQDTSTGLTEANFVDKEVPSGSINGSNTAFTLANTPVAGSEHGYLNGLLMESGSGNDYTISGATVTMLTAPLTGDKLRFSYRK